MFSTVKVLEQQQHKRLQLYYNELWQRKAVNTITGILYSMKKYYYNEWTRLGRAARRLQLITSTWYGIRDTGLFPQEDLFKSSRAIYEWSRSPAEGCQMLSIVCIKYFANKV